MSILSLPRNALWQLFPPHCLVCNARGLETVQRDLCSDCECDLPVLGRGCLRCAEPLSGAQSAELLCGRCLLTPPYFHRVYAPFKYQPPIKRLIRDFKYRSRFAAGHLLTELLAEHLAQQDITRPDYLLPVPLHDNRLCERGFNQSLHIAKGLSKRLHIPIAASVVNRLRDTEQQSNKSREERLRNLRNAFVLHGKIAANSVAIVDDVMTTGSTVNEIAKLLQQAGVQTIQVWICARTVRE